MVLVNLYEYCGKKCKKVMFWYISQKTIGETITFLSQNRSTHHVEQLEWSHGRGLINSKIHFLLENEILPHFLQKAGKTFHSCLAEGLITYTHHCD